VEVQPSAAGRIDLGLILGDVRAEGRLESAAGFNALFTHRSACPARPTSTRSSSAGSGRRTTERPEGIRARATAAGGRSLPAFRSHQLQSPHQPHAPWAVRDHHGPV